MSTAPWGQVPRSAEIIGAGLADLQQTLPGSFRFANNGAGRFGDIFAGWRAQASLAVRRLADECRAARLTMANGDELTELARSEFDTDRAGGTTPAIGSVRLTRPAPGSPLGGSFPRGFRFRRDALPSSIPSLPGMTYVAAQDTPVTSEATDVTVAIVATQDGANGNGPIYTSTSVGTVVMADTPFDTTFSVLSYEASGGSDGESDGDLVRQATAYASGQFAPTLGAIVAGALRGTGVHRAAVTDVTALSSGAAAAYTGVCIADQSWAAGPTWISSVKQAIATGFLGFGGRILVTGATNLPIRVECSITLRDANDLSFTQEITSALQRAATSYFDDRPDWYSFRLAALRATLSRADARILGCTSVSVKGLTGSFAVAEPSSTPFAISTGIVCTHYMLVQNGLTPTYSAPT